MTNARKRNGFSLVEVVIALSVIVVVSIAALSVVLSSIATRASAINKTRAQGFADNVWESFKAAQTQDEFLSNVFFAEGVSLTGGTTDESGNTVYTYYSEKYNFTAEIAVHYPENGRPELSVSVTEGDGDGIVSFTYRKGDGA